MNLKTATKWEKDMAKVAKVASDNISECKAIKRYAEALIVDTGGLLPEKSALITASIVACHLASDGFSSDQIDTMMGESAKRILEAVR